MIYSVRFILLLFRRRIECGDAEGEFFIFHVIKTYIGQFLLHLFAPNKILHRAIEIGICRLVA